MMRLFRIMAINFAVAWQLLQFLWLRKLWWLIPMTVVLLVFALFLIFASASGLGPFIYTIF